MVGRQPPRLLQVTHQAGQGGSGVVGAEHGVYAGGARLRGLGQRPVPKLAKQLIEFGVAVRAAAARTRQFGLDLSYPYLEE